MTVLAGVCCFQEDKERVHIPPITSEYMGTRIRNRKRGTVQLIEQNVYIFTYDTNDAAPAAHEQVMVVVLNGTVLAWYGRLDNRTDLISELGCHLSTASDAQIVMAAYAKKGERCLESIIGDWAVVVWERRSKSLLLARDCAGGKSLFYKLDFEGVRWCTQLRGLLELWRVDPEISDKYVAGFLALSPDPCDTPYRTIKAVPPGFAVKVSQGEVKEHRFWSPDTSVEIHYRSDREYEEHFSHLLRTAIKRRIRGRGPIAIQLSGGLDSSSIVCIAHELLRNGEIAASDLETISYVYDESRSSDEREFIDSVEAQIGKKGHHLLEDEAPCLSPPDGDFVAAPTFHHAFCRRQRRIEQLMRDIGSEVLLTGQGGDQLLYGSEDPSPYLADLLLSSKITTLKRYLQAWDKHHKFHRWEMLRNLTAVIASPSFRRRLRPTPAPLQWLNRDFVREEHLVQRFAGCSDEFGSKTPSKRERAGNFLSAVRCVTTAHFQEWWPFGATHPYLDRNLFEFLYAIPFEQHVRVGEGKSLLRRALRTTLPALVVTRKGKRGPDEAVHRSIAREWKSLRAIFSRSLAAELGYIDGSRFLKLLHAAAHGSSTPPTGALLLTICLEFWLISVSEWKPPFS